VDGGRPLERSFDLIIFLLLGAEIPLQRIKAHEISHLGRANPAFLAWASQYEVGRLAGSDLKQLPGTL
jgi:NhaP-type Na+/H+ or K+/H+ antiporter